MMMQKIRGIDDSVIPTFLTKTWQKIWTITFDILTRSKTFFIFSGINKRFIKGEFYTRYCYN